MAVAVAAADGREPVGQAEPVAGTWTIFADRAGAAAAH